MAIHSIGSPSSWLFAESFEFGVFRLLVTELRRFLRVMVLVGVSTCFSVDLDFWFALGLSAGFESHKNYVWITKI